MAPQRPPVPPDVLRLARERAAARRGRDWDTADRLKAELEAAGWRIVDRGRDFTLSPAAPPDVVEGDVVRYGSSASVPSRLDDAPIGTASVVIVVDDDDDVAGAERTVRGLAEHAPDGTQVVLVANALDPLADAALAALEEVGRPGIGVELLRTSVPLERAAARNAGLRRAVAPVVVLLDPAVEPVGDVVGPLVAELEDPDVAVAGPVGLVSTDLRRWEPTTDGGPDVDAIAGDLVAFRREDVDRRGPLDEHFGAGVSLDAWWSLVLRDEFWPDDPDAEAPDVPVRRAVRVDVPIVRHAGAGEGSAASPDDPGTDGAVERPDEARRRRSGRDDERRAKRDFYRLLKRFATRRDLLVPKS